jgi:hypothetical protein
MGSHERGGTAGTVFRKVGAFAKVCGWAWRPVVVKCRDSRLAAGVTNSDLGRSDSEEKQNLAGTFAITQDRASRSMPGLSFGLHPLPEVRPLSKLAAKVDVNDVGAAGRRRVDDVVSG